MQRRKFRIVSAAAAGGLALAVAAVAASSAASPPHVALAVRAAASQQDAALAGSFLPADLDKCPVLHVGYPTGGCVAQLQTDLNTIQGNHLVVDGAFGSDGSQTDNAVVAFQQAYGLKPDGMVGPDTKNALKAALAGDLPPSAAPTGPAAAPATSSASAPAPVTTPTASAPVATVPAPAVTAPTAGPAPAAAASASASASASGGSLVTNHCGIVTCSAYLSRSATKAAYEKVNAAGGALDALGVVVCAPFDVPPLTLVGVACTAVAEAQAGVIKQEITDAATQHGAKGACLKVTYTRPVAGLPPTITWWSTNNGQYCKD